jgi:D-alanine-D-alanine ligase
MKKSKKILVLMGGFSSEREVSLVSGKGAAKALEKGGYEVVAHDLTDIREFIRTLEKEKPVVVFNALHGTFGEDGTIQGFLDAMGVAYTHSGLHASVIGMNKILTKTLVSSIGVHVVPHQVFSANSLMGFAKNINIPFVAKPVSEGSSVGVFIVKNPEDIKNIRYENSEMKVMVEPFIDGKELTIAVLEDKALGVTELRPKEGFYDYENKYTAGKVEHVLPAEIPDDIAKDIREMAVAAHKVLGCDTLSRSDFRYNPKDGAVFLEINTQPGMTPLSLVPEQAEYAGISYEELCAILVDNALAK